MCCWDWLDVVIPWVCHCSLRCTITLLVIKAVVSKTTVILKIVMLPLLYFQCSKGQYLTYCSFLCTIWMTHFIGFCNLEGDRNQCRVTNYINTLILSQIDDFTNTVQNGLISRWCIISLSAQHQERTTAKIKSRSQPPPPSYIGIL